MPMMIGRMLLYFLWDALLEVSGFKGNLIEVKTTSAFLDKLNNSVYDGIIIVFNPFLNGFTEAWDEFQKNNFYHENPILYLANTGGIEYCQSYARKDIDIAIDFCGDTNKLAVDTAVHYIKTGKFQLTSE
jgi:hypothetical protein